MSRTMLLPLLAAALVCAFAPVAAAKDEPTLGLRYPSLSPDLKAVVFGYRGDIWSAPTDGKGDVDRLTLHEAQETLCRVSPDGGQIAFSSLRNGGYDLFVMPITGGLPRQVTFHSATEILCDWSPDGSRLLFASQRDVGTGGLDLYEVDVAGGTPRRITFDGGRDGNYSPDGKSVVYIRGFVDIYWDNYEGASNFDIYVKEVAGGLPRQVTATRGNERWPFFSADGRKIWFVAEEKGVANFYCMPAEGGDRTQVTAYTGDDVQRPCLCADRRNVVFERAGQLYMTDLENPGKAPTAIRLTIRSDVRNSGIERRTISGGGEQVDISRDGSQAAFTLRGDIWVMPASGGKGRPIASGAANEQWPRFSPDGKRIAYFSNATGNNDIYVVDLASGKTDQVTRHPANDFFHSWAPDGRRLVFTSERSGNRDIWAVDLVTGEETQLTNSPAADDDPCFSRDGKLVAFDSGRDGGQAIYVMNPDGSDVRRVTADGGMFQVPCFSPDGRMLVYEAFSPMGGSGGLFATYTNGGPSVRLSQDGSGSCWTADGKWIYFHAERGPAGGGIFRLPAPERIEAGEPVPFYGTMEVDIRQELANLFDEAWNALKDGFYDPKMHGTNWDALRKKYRDMAIDTENKAEFQNVLRQLIAELGASHLGIGGGEDSGSGVTPDREENGLLGLDFEPAPVEGGGRRIAALVAGGPADQAGLRVGDVVTRIGRTRLEAGTNIDQLTAGTVGKDLPVGFRPKSEKGLGDERPATLKPIGLMAAYELRYQIWEATCRKRVQEATKTKDGEVGYIHLTQMDPQNLAKFQQAVSRWNSGNRVKGMILDVRNNGGGNIHGQLIEVLSAKPLAMVQRRGGPKTPQPTLYWDRPVVVLTNERSFSDAEVFPWMFKAAGLGKVIGVPTAGGVIGTQDITLSDGSRFRIPTVGFWGMDGTALEGLGVKPDFLVPETPEDRAEDRDPQLAKAIEVILGEVKAREEAEKAAHPPAKPAVTEPAKPVEPVKPVEPAAPAAAPGLRPLLDAAVGEWVRYRTTKELGVESTLLVTVAEVKDGIVRFATKVEAGADPQLPFPAEAPADAELLTWLGTMGKVLGHRIVKAPVNGVEAELLQADVQWPDGSVLTLTLTEAVPCFGLLSVAMGKVTLLEAAEWGAPAPAAPPEKVEEKPAPPRHPIHDAKVGEWVKVKRDDGRGREIEMTMAVTEVRDDLVILSQVLVVAGREVRGPDIERPRDEFLVAPAGFTLVGYSTETVTVNARELTCTVMTATQDEGGTMWKWWVCPEVPVNGYVRVTRGDAVLVELVDWGFPAEK